MKKVGIVSKMVVQATTPITYELPLGDMHWPLNPYLGEKISLHFTQRILCQACGRLIKKSYQEGYCFPCTQRLARCDLCIVKPERCHFHVGTCREPDWGQSHCMIPHWVYLANASQVKVGITRQTQGPFRWIDQGAVAALPILQVSSRRIAGLVEVILGKWVKDKTNWRQMLMGPAPAVDLVAIRDELLEKTQEEVNQLRGQFGEQSIKTLLSAQTHQFEYPVLSYPTKIVSLSFDKTPTIEGSLLGIKGQYLILDTGVLNIRKHAGYEIEIPGM